MLLLVMLAVTVIYAGSVAYVTANLGTTGPVVMVSKCAGTPSPYYTPEQLQIIKIVELDENRSSLMVTFESNRLAFPCENPVFRYEDAYYEVSLQSGLMLPGGPKPVPFVPILIGALLVSVGWIVTVAVLLKEQKEDQKSSPHVLQN